MRTTLFSIAIFLFSGWLAILYVSSLSSCAQVAPLTGGSRDTIPPQLDTASSTLNFQTRFEKQTIWLVFDEFVNLKDVFNQVVVSPPLEKNPTVTLEKYKKVRFEFDEAEELRPEATYTIQFGEAIKDFTEGNASPIRFIFSTGDYIDSLQVQGKVVDAFSGKPVKDVLVLLYDNLADTVVRTERPFYFSKTDAEGAFSIENVKSDSFKVFALDDSNLNYLFDQSSERIGFPDYFIHTSDSISPNVDIRFFQEELPLRANNPQSPLPGLVKLTFNREPWDLNLSTTADSIFFEETIKDTVLLWHELSDTVSFQVFLDNEEWFDTLSTRPGKRPDDWDQWRLLPKSKIGRGGTVQQNPTRHIEIEWNFPIKRINMDSIQLWADSTLLEDMNLQVYMDSANLRKLTVHFHWLEAQNYQLLFLPEALAGWQDMTNDSLLITYKMGKREDLGSLQLSIDSLEVGKVYLVEVLQQDKPIHRYTLSGEEEHWETSIVGVKPGNYQLRLTEDLDGNGRWTPGNYSQQVQPERLLVWPLEQVRADWEVEANFVLKWE